MSIGLVVSVLLIVSYICLCLRAIDLKLIAEAGFCGIACGFSIGMLQHYMN